MTESTAPKRSIWAKIFISSDEPRFRAGWRLLAQTILMFVLIMCFSTPLTILMFMGTSQTDTLVFLLSTFAQLVAITVSVFLVRKFVDKRSITSLGLKLDRWVLFDLLAGIAVTFVMMGFIYFLMSSLGWITFKSFAWQVDPVSTVITEVVLFFIIFVLVGWQEELLSRGYQLQTIASGMNLFWGIFISSAIFGLLHLGNPNATWVSAAGIFFAGLFLASAYLWTKQLWLSIGLHIGWNFFEGVVFGFPVSGLSIYPLANITISGPEIWTGGAFGPEAGLIVLPGLILGTVLVFVYARVLRNQRSQEAELPVAEIKPQ
jgi:membrane protease YdiL (CAAX protease family)